jgi:hypothetical protein
MWRKRSGIGRWIVGWWDENGEWCRDCGREVIQHECEVTVWPNGVFDPSSFTIIDLTRQLDHTDFAIFVFHPDDEMNSWTFPNLLDTKLRPICYECCFSYSTGLI